MPDAVKTYFWAHLAAESEVIRRILDEVPGRRERLGHRIAARDIENALEDVVSMFEATLRFTYKRIITATESTDIAENRLRKNRTAFQNPERAAKVFDSELGIDLFEPLTEKEAKELQFAFHKRNVITHNLGIVDVKLLETGGYAEDVGRDVPLTSNEVRDSLSLVDRVLAHTYRNFNSQQFA